jgi:hypothetical protein
MTGKNTDVRRWHFVLGLIAVAYAGFLAWDMDQASLKEMGIIGTLLLLALNGFLGFRYARSIYLILGIGTALVMILNPGELDLLSVSSLMSMIFIADATVLVVNGKREGMVIRVESPPPMQNWQWLDPLKPKNRFCFSSSQAIAWLAVMQYAYCSMFESTEIGLAIAIPFFALAIVLWRGHPSAPRVAFLAYLFGGLVILSLTLFNNDHSVSSYTIVTVCFVCAYGSQNFRYPAGV